MRYILESNSATLINKTIEEIKTTLNIESDSVFYYDYDDTNVMTNVIGQYLSSSIFEDKKLIVIRNFNALTRKTKPLKAVVKKLDEIFTNDSENVIIFTGEKINEGNAYLAANKEAFKLIKLASPLGKELNAFVSNYFDKNQIEFDHASVQRIIDMTEGDFDHIVQELGKLKILGDKVTVETLERIVFDKQGESIFELVDSIFLKDIKKVSWLIDKMRVQDIEVHLIIQLLITDLSFMSAIKKLEETMTTNEILSTLKINPYRFRKIMEKANRYSKEEINILLNNIIHIEKMFKSNSVSEQHDLFKSKLISVI